MAQIFIRVHSPLFFCHFPTTIFHIRCSVAEHSVTSQVFSHEISRSESLYHFSAVTSSHWESSSYYFVTFSTATFSRWVSRSWSWHQNLWDIMTGFATVNVYCHGHIVGLVVLLVYYPNWGDGSGSLSSGAFNQLRLATLNLVLTILY